MNSRMERYSDLNSNSKTDSRVQKNQILYDEINSQTLSRINSNDNFKVIEEVSKDIDIQKIKKYISSLSEEGKERKRLVVNSKITETPVEETEEPRVYDINSIIEDAKAKKESSYEEDKYKKLHNTQYDILKKLEVFDKETEKIETEFNTNERTLIDLINTISVKKSENDLLSELTGGSDNTVVTDPIKEEIEKEEVQITEVKPSGADTANLSNIDKSFYTNSMNFSKEDFEGINELENEVTKNSFVTKFFIFLLILLVIGTIFVILNYVLNLGLF